MAELEDLKKENKKLEEQFKLLQPPEGKTMIELFEAMDELKNKIGK